MEDDGKVCGGDRLSTVNKLNGIELKIGDSHGVRVRVRVGAAESGSKEK